MAKGEPVGWIETIALVHEKRTRYVIKVDDAVVHADEIIGDDPSGVKAYEAAIAWTATNAPDVHFAWKHSRGDTTTRSPRQT